jgi:hypothetical protein
MNEVKEFKESKIDKMDVKGFLEEFKDHMFPNAIEDLFPTREVDHVVNLVR